MARPTFSDFSMRIEHTGAMAITKNNEFLCNISKRLFAMVPGMDDYNKDMGLDIIGRSHKPYAEGERDMEYEAMVADQYSKYTDIYPTAVLATYTNGILIVLVNGIYKGTSFMLRMTSDPKNLEPEILPKIV